MTAARFKALKEGAAFGGPDIHPFTEMAEFNRMLEWEKRSKAAKKAVATKRARYARWPTRRRKEV